MANLLQVYQQQSSHLGRLDQPEALSIEHTEGESRYEGGCSTLKKILEAEI